MSSQIQKVLNLKEALEKCMDADNNNYDHEQIHDILDRLNEIPMNLTILQETLIGATVNKVKKQYNNDNNTNNNNNNNKKVAVKAKSMIQKWKSVAAATTTTTTSNNNSTTSSDGDDEKQQKQKQQQPEEDEERKVSSKKPSENTTTNHMNIKKGMKKQSPNIIERRESLDSNNNNSGHYVPESEWIELPTFRSNICEKIYETLLLSKSELIKNEGVNEQAIGSLIAPRTAEIENAIYNKYTSDKKGYSDKSRSIVFNMKKNKVLTIQVCLGRIDVAELINYTTEQLADNATIMERQKDAKKLIDSVRLDWDEANEDKINKQCGITGDLLKASLFTCGRCKSIKTTSTQKQTRSADEPMTVFVLCLNCGKRWKC